MRNRNYWHLVIGFIACVLATLLTSCNTTKFLGSNDLLLEKNRIEVETDAPKDEVGSLSWSLSTLTKQKPNKKGLGMFRTRLWWYFKAQEHIKSNIKLDSAGQVVDTDTSRFYNFILRRVAEPPAYYSEEKTNATAQSMQYYLNNRGFYDAKVETEVEAKKHKVYVKYKVSTDSLMRIGAVYYKTNDSIVQPLISDIQPNSLLQPSIPLDSKTFNNEKNRIVKYLKNKGFCYFYPNYITYEGDSSGLKTDVTVKILSPDSTTFHQAYYLDSIYIHMQYIPTANIRTQYDTITYKGYRFIKIKGEPFPVQLSTLANAIYLRSGEMFRQEYHDQTSQRLGKLDIYKFISLKYTPNGKFDNFGHPLIDYNIYLTPAQKMDWGFNASVNYISGDNTIGEALGLFVNGNYRNKNIFNGAQALNINVGYGIEAPFGTDKLIDLQNSFTQDFRTQVDLLFPPYSNNANLRISSAYNLVQRFQQYDYRLITTELGIDYKKSNSQSFSFNPISINYLNPTVADEFQEILAINPLLERSFDQQFVIGGNFNFTFSKDNQRANESFLLRLGIDLSGNLLNVLDGAIDPETPFYFGQDSITYSQYSILEADFRYFKTFYRYLTLACRFDVGVGFPYGNSAESGLPYVKQFFAGGNASIRAWRVRQLGPGGNNDDLEDTGTIPFQTGDFKFIGNLELRFGLDFIFQGMEGAVFTDFGNVWSLTDDAEDGIRLLSTDNFLKRFAVGAGAGIRYDFSFFILRLDYAWRLRRTYSGTGNDADLSSFWEGQHAKLQNGRLNLAIGYPF